MNDSRLRFPFAPVPQTAMKALAGGAIDAIDLAIISVLLGGANWQTRQVTMTLEWLGERIDWKLTEDALYRRVTKLGRQWWYEYVKSPGKHGARYVFTLDPAPQASSEQSEDDPRSETLNHEERRPPSPRSVPRRASPGPRSDQAPNPQQEPDSASTQEAPIPRTSERQRETKACSEEKALGPGSARDQDHVVGEEAGSPARAGSPTSALPGGRSQTPAAALPSPRKSRVNGGALVHLLNDRQDDCPMISRRTWGTSSAPVLTSRRRDVRTSGVTD